LTTAERSIERESLGTSPTRNRERSLERLTLTVPRGTDSASNPWADTDPPYRSRFSTDPVLDRSARLRVELEDDDRRDFAHRLRQPWRPLDELNQNGAGRDESTTVRGAVRSGPLETMGCCWSPDGTIL
jgi:hypothetical protein